MKHCFEKTLSKNQHNQQQTRVAGDGWKISVSVSNVILPRYATREQHHLEQHEQRTRHSLALVSDAWPWLASRAPLAADAQREESRMTKWNWAWKTDAARCCCSQVEQWAALNCGIDGCRSRRDQEDTREWTRLQHFQGAAFEEKVEFLQHYDCDQRLCRSSM